MIRHAAEFARPDVPPEQGALWHPAACWTAPVPLAQVAGNGTGGLAYNAFISHGRWVVGCLDCSSAELACLTDPRFMCAECANVGNDHLFRRVIFPPNRAEIEAALLLRPVANRNWMPPETLEDLLAENAEHHLGVTA